MPKASPKTAKSKTKSGRETSRAVALLEEPAERGLLLRMFLHSPKDVVAGLIAFSAVSAIIGNAIFLQTGHHPSPMFGATVVDLPAPAAPVANPLNNPLPKPRPLDADTSTDTRLDSRMLDSRPVNPASEPKASVVAKPVEQRAADPIANLVKAPPAATSSVPRPPAAIPHPGHSDPLGDLITNTRRVAAVQRALTQYGYGQLKPTGNVGSDTQAAIQRFERERNMPVTGKISDRLVRELSAVTGAAID